MRQQGAPGQPGVDEGVGQGFLSFREFAQNPALPIVRLSQGGEPFSVRITTEDRAASPRCPWIQPFLSQEEETAGTATIHEFAFEIQTQQVLSYRVAAQWEDGAVVLTFREASLYADRQAFVIGQVNAFRDAKEGATVVEMSEIESSPSEDEAVNNSVEMVRYMVAEWVKQYFKPRARVSRERRPSSHPEFEPLTIEESAELAMDRRAAAAVRDLGLEHRIPAFQHGEVPPEEIPLAIVALWAAPGLNGEVHTREFELGVVNPDYSAEIPVRVMGYYTSTGPSRVYLVIPPHEAHDGAWGEGMADLLADAETGGLTPWSGLDEEN